MDRDNTIARLENIAKHAVHTAGEDTFILSLDDGLAIHEAIEALKAQLFSEDTTSDLISKTEVVKHLRRMLESTVPNTDYDEGYIDGIEFGISTVSTMPTVQPVATDTNVGDTISRQAAIDAVRASYDEILDFKSTGRTVADSVEDIISELPSAQPEPQWISVTERLPDNADHPGAFCPRYQVVTPYGVTEGWYRPHDHEKGGQWFALFWFMSQTYEIWNIDFERGDVPKVIGEAPVMEWRPLPEPYKPSK